MYINSGGTWKTITDFFINVSGTWKRVTDGFINVAGTWKRFWTGGNLAPQSPVTISQSTNATTGLITLTGTNYSWTPGPPSLTYYFEWSTNGGSTWTTMLSNTAINPAYGSSTSYTYTIDSVGPPLYFSPNVVNTYRFRIDATYGSLTGSSSATTTVQGPTNVTLTAGTAGPTSVPLSWTSSSGANRYMVYYAISGNSLSLYAGTSNLSITVSGLNPGTTYDFKIQPITGTSNNTGYYGNYSNTATTSTSADLTNTAIPTISGTLTEGQTVTMSNGSWNLTPDSYSYQWLYYDQPTAGYQGYVAISGATSSSYTIPTNYRDVYGQYIRARVTATKSGYTTTSAYSTAQTVAYDATLPQPPTGLNVTDVGTNRPFNNAAYSLSWTAPTDTGGVSLTGYKIQYQVPSTGTTWYNWSANATDTSSTSITLTGFGSNLSTNFRVYSVNSVGQSTSPVTTASAILGTTVPQAPTIGTATSFNTYISVTYTANATGGKAINTYTATSSPGSLTGSTSSGSIIVYNVVHNTAYTFTVTASNANGTSASSSASNTAYGVNIGAVSNITSTSTSSSITLNFTQGTNSTSTRGYLNGSLDGTTTGSSYLFAGLSASTSYSLGLTPIATVNGTLYTGPTTTGSYSTSAIAVPSNTSIPTLSPTSISVGTTLTAGVGTWANSPTSYDIRIYRGTAGVLMSETLVASTSGSGTSLTYTVTQSDYNSGQLYFRTYVNATNAGGSSGFVAGQERGPIAAPTPKPPNAPTGLTTPSSGTSPNLVFNSSSWTAPTVDSTHNAATYYQVYFEAGTSSTGPWAAANNTFSYNYYPGSPLTTATNANTAASAVSVYATSVSSGRITSGTTYTWVNMWVRAANADGYSAWVSKSG